MGLLPFPASEFWCLRYWDKFFFELCLSDYTSFPDMFRTTSQGVEVIIISVVWHCFNHANRQSQIRGFSDRSMPLSWKKSEFVSILSLVYLWICCYIYVAVIFVTEHVIVIFTHFETTKISFISWAPFTNCSSVSATLLYGWLVAIGFDNCLVLSSLKP